MTAANELRLRRELGSRLKRYREAAGLSGAALAHLLDRSQPWVSRVERAKTVVDAEEVEAWLAATRRDNDTEDEAEALDEMLDLLSRSFAEYDSWFDRSMAAGGASAKQAEIAELEATCVRLAEFQPALVPGLLQTAGYARDVIFGPGGPVTEGTHVDDAAAIVSLRMQRQQVLYSGSGKTHTFVMLEAALHTRVAGPDAMRGQLAHLAALCEGPPPGLTIGIVPFTTRVPIAPTSGFALFDDELVVLEGPDGGEWKLTSPVVTTNYDRLLELALEAAVTGAEAAALCRRAGVGTAE